ncbi:class I SAM-dependent RNA methyltransferase [Schaalia sp. lx-100]|uniref:class I SAM-dependent RNA methyltransferase n=1 Tax=Schaalia sp. lx-100 TaxID=2899081 RepID=UPI001E584075|nr:TRAM domain-containing protein [Schaalia sp. lx-100]MCD4558036.1 TRAM domain-containing protein [Schaalia sp. lx-100]
MAQRQGVPRPHTRKKPVRNHAKAELSSPQYVTLRVAEPAHGGACVARDTDGRVIFVRHALPGEYVQAVITRTRSRLAWADTVEVLEASPDRVSSVWPEASRGGVGGGELAHVRVPAQRQWKEQVIRGQIRRIAGIALAEAVEAVGGYTVYAAPGDWGEDDPLLGRRTRIELVADSSGALGMTEHRGRAVYPLSNMPLAVEAISDLGLFASPAKRWAGAWQPGDRIRVVASTGGDIAVVTPRGVYDCEGNKALFSSLRWNVHLRSPEVLRGSGFSAGMSQPVTFSDDIPHVLNYRVRPEGFWQTHREGADVLASAVCQGAALNGGESVLELYSGAGLFSYALASCERPPARILSVEGDEYAVADAERNCAPTGRVQTWVGSVDAFAVQELCGKLPQKRPDVIVLDPPRAGAGRDICHAIGASGAHRVVLVSCDPAAGARDMAALAECGYSVTSFGAWDLFPHTHHVETVCVMKKA